MTARGYLVVFGAIALGTLLAFVIYSMISQAFIVAGK